MDDNSVDSQGKLASPAISEGDVSAALLEHLASELELSGSSDEQGLLSLPLSELGVNSFALIEMVLFLERQFGSAFPLSNLTPDNTATLTALSRSYCKLLKNPASKKSA
jgi:acyl carrier protein